MKKIFFLFVFCAITSLSFAQRDETLFSNSNGRIGFFATPWLTEYGQFGDETRPSFGGGAGLIVGDFFLGGYGLANTDYEALIFEGESVDLNLAHGGLWIGYVPMQHKAVHPYSTVRLGWGAVNLDGNSFDFDDETDGVNVVTPELGLEVNIFRWMRLAGAAGYRWVNDIETSTLGSRDLNGWTASINLRFGWFGRNRGWRNNRD